MTLTEHDLKVRHPLVDRGLSLTAAAKELGISVQAVWAIRKERLRLTSTGLPRKATQPPLEPQPKGRFDSMYRSSPCRVIVSAGIVWAGLK